MIPTTSASADIQAIVHHKSSVFTLIARQPNKAERLNIDAAASRT
jgi:hypothetical protein